MSVSNTPTEPNEDEWVPTFEHVPPHPMCCDSCKSVRKAARDLYDDAGVDDIDQRLDYLMVQIGREVWNDFVAVIDP